MTSSRRGTPTRIEPLLELVYDAAASDDWKGVLENLRSRLGGAVGIHEFDLDGGRGRVDLIVGFPPDAARQYRDRYSSLNPWMHRSRRSFHPGEIVLSSEIFPESALRRTEFFNDLLLHHDFFRSLGGVIRREGRSVLSITNVRSEAAGEYTPQEVDDLRRLLPHLQRAWNLGTRLAQLEVERAATLHSLDLLPQGVYVLDGLGRLVIANEEGRRILDAHDGLSSQHGELRAAQPSLTRRLQRSLAQVALLKGAAPPALTLPRPSGARPYAARVVPLPASLKSAPGRPAVLLFVTETERRPTGDARLLAELYSLTPAEARLALALAAGESLQEIAAGLAVSSNTVRTQLRHVFEKTGVARQAELVSLILATAVPGGAAS
jgi:DNA-binding CsgD family transcriptional regulator